MTKFVTAIKFADMGRGKPVSTEQMREVLSDVYNGLRITESLKRVGITMERFYTTLSKDPELCKEYSFAQESRSELLVDEIIDIADNDPDPIRARNRIDARKWIASKMRPTKYGDHIDVKVTHTLDIAAALQDARNRILPVCDQRNSEMTQHVEIVEVLPPRATGSQPDEHALSEPIDLLEDDDPFSD